MTEITTIYPVILSVPGFARHLPLKSRGVYLSRYAREALALSAQKSGMKLGQLSKNPEGAPLPFDGIYWSLTHKPRYVGAIVGPSRVGIDIEHVAPRSPVLFNKAASQDEWALGENASWELFYRYWTSKEAVVKAAGSGIFKDLSECRVIQIIDQNNLVVDYRGNRWQIEHCYFNDHIASVVKDSFIIEWSLI